MESRFVNFLKLWNKTNKKKPLKNEGFQVHPIELFSKQSITFLKRLTNPTFRHFKYWRTM